MLLISVLLSMQDDGVAAGEEKEKDDIGDLDDLLRREREMEKKRKESAPTDAEVRQVRSAMVGFIFLAFWGGVVGGAFNQSPWIYSPPLPQKKPL